VSLTGRTRLRLPLVVLGLLLSGCEDKQPLDAAARAQQAAEHRLRSHRSNPVGVIYRGVQTYRQAAPDTFAVCGEVSFTRRSPDRYVPFVSIVVVRPGTPIAVDQRVTGENWDALRMHAETITHCVAGGGPTLAPPMPAPMAPDATPPMGPFPVEIIPVEPAPVAPSPTPQVGPPMGEATPRGKIDVVFTTRAPANLREYPSGPVIDRIPSGAKLRVFSVAPGGWVLVGDLEPLGWIHGRVRVASPLPRARLWFERQRFCIRDGPTGRFWRLVRQGLGRASRARRPPSIRMTHTGQDQGIFTFFPPNQSC
jgi:hypothetical protein